MTRSFETLTSPYLDGESPFTNAVSFSRPASPASQSSGELESAQDASEAESDAEAESLVADIEAEWRALSEAEEEAEEAEQEQEQEQEQDTEAEAETEFGGEPELETAEAETETESELELKSVGSDSELELQPETELEFDSESESYEEPQPELETEEESEPETVQESELETDETEQDEAEAEDTEYEDGAGQKTITARVLLDTPIQRGDSFALGGKVLGSDAAKQLLPGEYFVEFDKIVSGKPYTLLHYHGDGFSTKTPVSKKVKRTTFLDQLVTAKQKLGQALPVMQLLALKVQVPEKLKERTGREVELDPDLRGRSPTLVHLKVSEP